MSAGTDDGAAVAELGGDYYPEAWLRRRRQPERAIGIADLHTHPMAQLAFCGGVLHGSIDGDPELALAHCSKSHTFFRRAISRLIESPRHGRGFPDFGAWPTFDGLSHQQMHVEWIRRAHRGGLRLMVAHVLNNELLAWLCGAGHPPDDAWAIESQLKAVKGVAERHGDLLEIAYSPMDARRIIAADRIAVVLGAEVDSLFEAGLQRGFGDPEAWLQHLYGLGIRHVFPVHLADGAYGGAAVFGQLFDVNNRFLRGRPFELIEEPGLGLVIGQRLWTRALAGRSVWAAPAASMGCGHANARGLSDLGRNVLLPAMIRLGFVVDLDHMSGRCIRDTLDVLEKHDVPPVASHAAFRDLSLTHEETSDSTKHASEYLRTRNEMERIAALRGLVGVGWNQRDLRDYAGSLARVANDSASSSKSWAQAYLYAVELAGGGAVALGSDANGLAGAAGPRFGPRASSGLDHDAKRKHLKVTQRLAQTNAVAYEGAETSPWPTRCHPPLTPCRTGHRVFDVNVDGVAHYGMMPDFLQDLRNVGVTRDLLTSLFSSAEAYVTLWERIYRTC
jgi:microsomal dipeptidase-like Zn-dependent dipeptidase